MEQFKASAARKAGIRVGAWKWGWEPGKARSKKERAVLGREEVELDGELEKSLVEVLSWAWISMPMVSSQSGRDSEGAAEGVVRLEAFLRLISSLMAFRRGTGSGEEEMGEMVIPGRVVVVGLSSERRREVQVRCRREAVGAWARRWVRVRRSKQLVARIGRPRI